jgi:oleandomycin transport system permease protein
MSAIVTTADHTAVAAAPSARVSSATAVRNTLTIAWRSLVQIKHSPLELVDLSVQPLMFVLLFAFVFGGAMAGRAGSEAAGRQHPPAHCRPAPQADRGSRS